MNYWFKKYSFKKYIQLAVLGVLSLFLLYTLWQIVQSLAMLKQEGRMSYRKLHLDVQRLQVSDIHSWMTFRYINVVYNLPPAYLQEQLNIIDSRYPNISINVLAQKQRRTVITVLTKTQESVKNYFINQAGGAQNP